MGRRTLDQFRDQLNHALGEKAQFNERLDAWINDAVEELFVMLDIEGRRVCAQTETVANQQRYLLPENLVALLVLSDRTNKEMILRTGIENFERLDPTKTGQPKVYGRVDRHVYLHPTPATTGDVLHMFYIKAPDVLVDGTDVSELTSAYDRVIHLLAAKNALLDLGQDEKATMRHQAAVNMLRTIPTEEWLEGQVPGEGIQIPTTRGELTDPPSFMR